MFDFFGSRQQLSRIENLLREIKRDLKEHFAMAQADIDNLGAKVEKMTSAVDSASALITTLAQLIRDNADDPAELKALADRLDAKATELADQVVANTPGQPTPSESGRRGR